jgi:hypothetical protein
MARSLPRLEATTTACGGGLAAPGWNCGGAGSVDGGVALGSSGGTATRGLGKGWKRQRRLRGDAKERPGLRRVGRPRRAGRSRNGLRSSRGLDSGGSNPSAAGF